MTTKKPTSAISKHKSTTTRKPAPVKSPQVFDIIPRRQVRPQANARPVIPSGQPMVADNTLTTAPQAPSLQLKHKPVSIEPTKDGGPAKESGVSVSELIAKRSKQQAQEAASVDVAPASIANSNKATEDEVKRALEEPQDEPVVASELPANTVEAAETSDAARQAEELLAEKPPEAQEKTEEKPMDGPAADTVTDTAKPVAAADASADSIEDNESLQKVLNGNGDDTKETPQEHSQALKDAIKDIDDDGGERPHHELYGGKPVIVVHKDHAMSALAWTIWFLVCVGLALVIVNFLLDGDIIQTTYNVPHTDLL